MCCPCGGGSVTSDDLSHYISMVDGDDGYIYMVDSSDGIMSVDFSNLQLDTYSDTNIDVTVKLDYSSDAGDFSETNSFTINLIECELSDDTILDVSGLEPKYFIMQDVALVLTFSTADWYTNAMYCTPLILELNKVDDDG